VTGRRDGARPDRTAAETPVFLVAGGTRVDAGKTTFSTGLLAALSARFDDAIGVKPRAGNDYWFDHDDYRLAAGSGRLYGADARKLAAASTASLDASGAVTPESINPLHRLWRPTPGRTGLLGETDRTFLCDRLTTPDGSRFVLNEAAAEAELIPAGLRDRLPLADAIRVADVADLDEVTTERYLPAFDRLADRVGRADAPVVVESYGDVAAPLDVAFDAVAVVEPGAVRVYAGDRYRRACAVASGSPREGRLETHTDAVTPMIDPLSTVPLPALSGDERGDSERIADRYASAYDALIGAA
jgi:predicted P-loop ATPase/GTPase